MSSGKHKTSCVTIVVFSNANLRDDVCLGKYQSKGYIVCRLVELMIMFG